MTINEMHIELDQSLQQVAANVSRKYLPEEYDWILNKIEKEFIQSHLRARKDGSGGFEFDQLSTDALRNHIVSGKELLPYLDNDSRYKCVLPHDYAYLLSDQSYTDLLCGTAVAEVVDSPIYLSGIRQSYSTKSSAPYYQTMAVNQAGKTINIPGNLPFRNVYSGYMSKQDISFLVPWVAATGEFFWERFGDIMKDGTYISATSTQQPIPTMTIDSSDVSVTYSETLNWQIHKDLGKARRAGNRLTASSKVTDILTTKYYETAYYSPISELSGGFLYVYRDNSFIVSKVVVSYIRKSRPMSLSLGCNSELPEQFHQTICDLAVQYVKGRLENQLGEALAEKHNETRVVL